MTAPPLPSQDYPFEDFLRDFDAMAEAGAFKQGPYLRILGEMRHYFHEAYSGDQRLRMVSFAWVLQYLCDNIQGFDQGDLAVWGSPRVGGLVSEHLLEAIHQKLVLEKRPITQPPSVAEIRTLAGRIGEKRRSKDS